MWAQENARREPQGQKIPVSGKGNQDQTHPLQYQKNDHIGTIAAPDRAFLQSRNSDKSGEK